MSAESNPSTTATTRTKNEHSPYVYNRAPSFKQNASALDIKALGADSTFYGNLVISCSGEAPCYSKLSKLLARISSSNSDVTSFELDANDVKSNEYKSSNSWSDDDRMTIRGAFWTKSEKLRIYFISLLENTQLSSKYSELYNNLRSVQYKISEDKADSLLNSFVSMVRNNDGALLQCLSNYKCTQQSRPLWNELQDNIVDNDLLDDQAILDKLDEVRSSPFYGDILRCGVELDDNEILAIYIYSSLDEFADLMQKHVKIPCKWKQTFYYFVRGVLKIYDCKVYGAAIDSLPSSLYHPVFLSFDNVSTPLPLLTTINCTSSKSAAKDFTPPDGSMFVLRNCGEALSSGSLIAAPINWISPHPNEDEWVVLPCTFIECNPPCSYVHNAQLIEVIKYSSINPQLLGVDIYTKLNNLQYICDLAPKLNEILEEDHDIEYYRRRCNVLQNEINELKKKKGDIVIPFKLIRDEAFLISDNDIGASMCVTSCDGELNPPFISAKGIKWLKNNFISSNLDIFVDTYAKCGTTVGIKMIYKILSINNIQIAASNKDKLNDPWNAVPWIEVDVSQQLLGTPSPNDFLSFIEESNKRIGIKRIWKTHSPLNNFPAKQIGENTKIIHIIRNPKDVICSYFDFFRKEPLVNYRGSFNTLFDWFCDGAVVHSSFFEFELNWFRAKHLIQNKQLLIISYEDIVRKPIQIIKIVSNFLGFKDMNQKQIEFVRDSISFERSKKEAQQSSDMKVIVNKGKIGRWKGILTKNQSDRIDRIIDSRLRDSGIQFTFE